MIILREESSAGSQAPGVSLAVGLQAAIFQQLALYFWSRLY
jgi:hypothetical protein